MCLSRFPEVGDAVDGDEVVVAVDEDPQLVAAGQDQVAVVDARAVDEREVHPATLQIAQLLALVRKGLIRPQKAELPGEDAFRFHHLLLRDAAYDALPKATRAELHRRFADWVEQHGTQLVELDELVGYHLERAARCLDELGQDNGELALAAGERLGAAGRRAFWRGDWRTAAALLERSLSLTRPYRLELGLEVKLADALYWTDLARAVAVADAAAERATATGDAADAALARTAAALARMHSLQCSTDEVRTFHDVGTADGVHRGRTCVRSVRDHGHSDRQQESTPGAGNCELQDRAENLHVHLP